MPLLSGPSRLPASGNDPDSLIVMLHGIGANGEDLIGLADQLGPRFPRAAFHSPDAPERYAQAGFGFQWYARDPLGNRNDRVRTVEGLVNDYIDRLIDQYRIAADRCVLLGFSQGCMVALHVGPRRAAQLAGVVGISGSLLTGDTLVTEVQSKPPMALVHGSEDMVVDPTETAEAGRRLAELGFDVEAHILPGLGHGVDLRGLEITTAFIDRVLA